MDVLNKPSFKEISPYISTKMETFDLPSSGEDGAKRPRGRQRYAMWRWNEDGTYNNGPSSQTYFKDYYHEKLAFKVECPLCKSVVGQQKLKDHQATRKCAKLRSAVL